MSQHFLLTAAARTLSLKSIFRMSDDEAHDTFTAIRFADNGGAACQRRSDSPQIGRSNFPQSAAC